MRYIPHRFIAALLVTSTYTCPPIWAQMHKVSKPEQVVRAVGVYEWTGDFAKPTASRLIPVSLFIEGKLEDAGVYIARPVPFALLSGNVYELQDAGIDKGFLDLAYAKHLQATTSTGDLAYDDGWFGYGTVKPLTAPRRTASALKPSKTLPVLTSSNDSSRPHLTTKTGADSTSSTDQSKPASKPDTSSTSTASTDDPDRPTMKRRSSDTDSTTNSTGTTTASSSTPADDPDRPTMKRRDSTPASSDSSATQTSSTGTTTTTGSTPTDDPDRPTMTRRTPGDTTTTDSGSTGSTTAGDPPSSNDPDRPTLKRHTPEEAKKTRNNTDSVTGTGSLNEDPDRPNLHRGKPTSAMTDSDLPKLVGIPSDLHQMIAVSDAANRDVHPFALEWDDATQHAAVLQKMQDMARAQLAAYMSTPTKTATPTPKPAAKTTTPVRTHHPATPAAAPIPLLDEELKAYTLSYGGAATYIYSAHTIGTGAALRYVTIVAQADGLGELKPAIKSVTDAAHLDRSPQMRFVDVVDAEASNRASLLFELRGQNSRQFGLYRVIASHSDQIFLTGTTQ
ncbi:hypothetical protein [Tunturiibacter lichenicola]|uniref:hypothetical protein n=1 Tax=Tunturiibacter lichenicola TaxID=2051959 RepID=UPI003D9B261B